MRTNPADTFADSLRALHITCGKPSYLRICELAEANGGHPLSPSTISEVLNAKRLPKLEFVRSFVRALLRHRDGVDAPARHEAELRKWQLHWQRAVLRANGLAGNQTRSGVVEVVPRPTE